MGQFDTKTPSVGISGIQHQQIVADSRTVFCSIPGWYLITAIGGGGSGGRVGSANGMAATGGGAGGFCQKKIKLNTGDAIVCVIGAGGVGVAAGSNGNAGGDTSVIVSGLRLLAKGGSGGNQATGAVTAPGAVGGMAFGGDVNFQGGGSGYATTSAVASCNAQTGGGAVGIYGIGYSSGNAVSTSGYNALTGGAGVGGRSGNATASTVSSMTYGGAQYGGAGDSTSGYGGAAVYSDTCPVSSRFLSPCGNKSYGIGNQYNIPGYPGSGGKGSSGGNGYEFSGGGGGAATGTDPGGSGGFCGGGGGANSASYTTGNSGAGGQGIVVIELLGANL